MLRICYDKEINKIYFEWDFGEEKGIMHFKTDKSSKRHKKCMVDNIQGEQMIELLVKGLTYLSKDEKHLKSLEKFLFGIEKKHGYNLQIRN